MFLNYKILLEEIKAWENGKCNILELENKESFFFNSSISSTYPVKNHSRIICLTESNDPKICTNRQGTDQHNFGKAGGLTPSLSQAYSNVAPSANESSVNTLKQTMCTWWADSFTKVPWQLVETHVKRRCHTEGQSMCCNDHKLTCMSCATCKD